MKLELKLLFLAGLFLVFAQAVPAQKFITSTPLSPAPVTDPNPSDNLGSVVNPGFYAPENVFANDFYYPNGSSASVFDQAGNPFSNASGISAEGAAPSAVYGFAQGDADFVPSTYVSYNKAVALGNQALQEENAPPLSLGDVARAYRAQSQKLSPNAKLITVSQDSSGRMMAC